MQVRRSLSTVLLSLGLVLGLSIGTATVAPAQEDPSSQATSSVDPAADAVTFGASAWGSTVSAAGPVLSSGKSALATLSCTQKVGITKSNDLAAVDVAGLVSVDGVSSQVRTRTVNGQPRATSQSKIAGASVLGGQVEVGAITTTAMLRKAANGKYLPSTSFSIASVKIAGKTIKVGTERKVVKIDGVAEVILNDRTHKSYSQSGSAAATAVTVKVLETGAVIRLGEARASLNGLPINNFMAGNAYGTKLTVGNTVKSGATAYLTLPCQGTKGEERTNQVASVNLPGVGTVRGVESTISGTQTPTPRAKATNTIAGVDLLGGLASIEGITTSVEAWRESDGSLAYTPHAKIGAIKVAGISIDLPSTPGARLTLPGVGELRFMDVKETANGNGVTVVGAKLELLGGQLLQLGQAHVALKPLQ